MFSYRHAFHAGNHADVLKHAILLQIFDYYAQKDSPYSIIDTHTGSGLYDLEDDWAQTKGEFYDGLDKVLQAENPPAMVERYLDAIADLNPDGIARYYPGSPWLALTALRPQDSFHGFELHPSEFQTLNDNVKQLFPRPNRRVRLYAENGFDGIKRLLPPPSRRAVVVMDPSYEAKGDYRQVQHSLNEALRRFAQCCFVIWYPLVQRPEVQQLRRYLESQTLPWLHTSLTVRAPSRDGLGLHGSGMFIVNPPWTLYQSLSEALPWLKAAMAQDNKAQSYLQQHKL
ncbi:23S rRNA (adenine(2030)-N(6))-methyltransferase RlmJ [Alcaligenes endophyticus]|uniref:Ribosomal RNA large subunit methyltransferase J n=1 Tax=Alcaligenes endophyticus TaxID=1929088 RepID=A0ABT8EK25_9BURK|nr:23S rRNA (adenine(2030)-N(6))-methyltransferase RlmJ [Alcaligenes endophyticus]MCX5591946.1 23S rRNA (adenine(2030)-N(6))-methyltransferase RlmJ [Alcaligenes endophyticus]MDN4121636.1 23S rRNA (adenine(2030)-N(6))-methyltransferase RlmJ [Alcaligenes endophyticus]